MKRASLLAVAIVLVANAFALVHAWRNRAVADADVTLTQRELALFRGETEDDSEIALFLRWTDSQRPWLAEWQITWLGEKKLAKLGFDTSVAAGDEKAVEFYQRQRARRAFIALEYDGPAWQKWIDDVGKRFQEHPDYSQSYNFKEQRESATRLIAIDADRDAGQLRARHPDRGSVIIVPAVIAIGVRAAQTVTLGVRVETPAQLVGSIRDLPTSIHVPRPFSDEFRRRVRGKPGWDVGTKYRVHLRYGESLEPWVVGIEIP